MRALGAACGARFYVPAATALGAGVGPAGTASAAAAPAADRAGGSVRLALLLGNRRYPEPFDLPPVPKNVRDLGEALKRIGFQVSDGIDLPLPETRSNLANFVRAAAVAPDDAIVLFYYTGHGAQVDAANLLLPADLSPAADARVLSSGSTQLLRDVVGALPARPRGMVIAVIDACRTNLKVADGGLNQVEAPPGCLIAFSTGAGRPAIAPASPDQNTFYTAALVRQLDKVREETTFAELFQLTRADVRTTMLNFPVVAIRKLAQDPFIADNSGQRPRVMPLSLLPKEPPPPPPPPAAGPEAPKCTPATDARFACKEEQDDWEALSVSMWPSDIVKLGNAFVKAYPESRFRGSAEAGLVGASDAARILQRPTVKLFRSAFRIEPTTPAEELEDVRRASRGDKDAAARQGRRYLAQAGTPGLLSGRYEGWMQYAAALGNGIASYELSKFYGLAGQPALESEFETRARELGYNPPPSLDNKRS